MEKWKFFEIEESVNAETMALASLMSEELLIIDSVRWV
jgi:hypothetical protein